MREHERRAVFVTDRQDLPGYPECDRLTTAQLLAEPDRRDRDWITSVVGRLVVASTGPVLVGAAGDAAAIRLEEARWLRVAPDADLRAARAASWPRIGRCAALSIGFGSLAPRLVLVGERDPHERQPFYSKSGLWLFLALRDLGYDELSVYVTNAYSSKRHSQGDRLSELHAVFADYEPTWIAFGDVASNVLSANAIGHLRAPHPAWHRRFKYEEDVSGYCARLLAAGLVPGPWRDRAFPTAAPDPTLQGLYGLNRKTISVGQDVLGRLPGPLVTNPVRSLYVSGEAKSIAEACRLAGISGDAKIKDIFRVARNQRWDAERAEQLDRIREKVKASAADAEAKAIAESRRLAWGAATLTLAKFLHSVKSDAVKPRAQDVKAIVDAALALSEKGDVGTEAERARLSALDPRTLAKELQSAVDSMFGTETGDSTLAPETPRG